VKQYMKTMKTPEISFPRGDGTLQGPSASPSSGCDMMSAGGLCCVDRNIGHSGDPGFSNAVALVVSCYCDARLPACVIS
jgi:hypothetical protein